MEKSEIEDRAEMGVFSASPRSSEKIGHRGFAASQSKASLSSVEGSSSLIGLARASLLFSSLSRKCFPQLSQCNRCYISKATIPTCQTLNCLSYIVTDNDLSFLLDTDSYRHGLRLHNHRPTSAELSPKSFRRLRIIDECSNR